MPPPGSCAAISRDMWRVKAKIVSLSLKQTAMDPTTIESISDRGPFCTGNTYRGHDLEPQIVKLLNDLLQESLQKFFMENR